MIKLLPLLALLYSFTASAAWNATCFVTAARQHGLAQIVAGQKSLALILSNESVVLLGNVSFMSGKTELPFDDTLQGYNGKKVNCYYGQVVYAGSNQATEMEFQTPKNNFNSPMFSMYARFSAVLKVDVAIYSLSCQVVPSLKSAGVPEPTETHKLKTP